MNAKTAFMHGNGLYGGPLGPHSMGSGLGYAPPGPNRAGPLWKSSTEILRRTSPEVKLLVWKPCIKLKYFKLLFETQFHMSISSHFGKSLQQIA